MSGDHTIDKSTRHMNLPHVAFAAFVEKRKLSDKQIAKRFNQAGRQLHKLLREESDARKEKYAFALKSHTEEEIRNLKSGIEEIIPELLPVIRLGMQLDPEEYGQLRSAVGISPEEDWDYTFALPAKKTPGDKKSAAGTQANPSSPSVPSQAGTKEKTCTTKLMVSSLHLVAIKRALNRFLMPPEEWQTAFAKRIGIDPTAVSTLIGDSGSVPRHQALCGESKATFETSLRERLANLRPSQLRELGMELSELISTVDKIASENDKPDPDLSALASSLGEVAAKLDKPASKIDKSDPDLNSIIESFVDHFSKIFDKMREACDWKSIPAVPFVGESSVEVVGKKRPRRGRNADGLNELTEGDTDQSRQHS